MKRVLTFGIFLLILTSTSGFSQDGNGLGGAYIEQVFGENLQARNQVILENDVFLKQTGLSNSASIQQSAGLEGANLASVRQRGTFQQIVLGQYGSNNRANLLQIGRNNEIDITVQGNNVSNRVFQIGRNNLVQQELGRDNARYTIFQHGYNHEVIDLGFADSPGYTIRQTGMVGMKVTIEHH